MGCRGTRKRLSAYLDKELPADEALRIESHILDCASCSAELKLLMRLEKAVLPERPIEPTGNFEERVLARLEYGKAEPAVTLRPRFIERINLFPLPVEVAATLIVGILIGASLGLFSNRDTLSASRSQAKVIYSDSIGLSEFTDAPAGSVGEAYLRLLSQ